MAHPTAKIRLETSKEVAKFVSAINSDGTIIRYTITNDDNSYRVNARSYLGVLYASAEFGGILYLVNETNNEEFPNWVDDFRPLSENNGGDYIHR